MAENKKADDTKKLVDEFNEMIAEELGVEFVELTTYKTDIPIYDIFSGGGLLRGSWVEFIGNPGAGKSTLSLSMASRIKRNYPATTVIIVDVERALTKKRLLQLGFREEDLSCVHLINTNITIETVFDKYLKTLINIKQRNEKFIEIPSIFIWDSIAVTPTEKESQVNDINEVIGLKARIIGSKISVYEDYLAKLNINFIAINQLRDKVKMGGVPTKDINIPGLGDKTVPGGKAQYFISQHFLLLERKEKLDESTYGFDGYVARGKFLKNKTAVPLKDFYLVMSYKYGVNDFYTKFYYLKEAKAITTSGGWYSLAEYGKKFRAREAEKIYLEDEKFRTLFDTYFNKLSDMLIDKLQN